MAVNADAIAAMLDVLFNDPNLSAAGIMEISPGAYVPCRVLFRSASDPVGGSLSPIAALAETDVAEIRVCEISERVQRGANLLLGDRTYRIGSPAESGRNGRTWRLILSDD